MVTESVLPQVDGGANSVQRMCEHLHRRGHEVLVIAPGDGPRQWAGARVVRTPSAELARAFEEFRPDVVHLAASAMPSDQAALVARELKLPLVEQWARGLDLDLFHPRHRDAALRADLAPGGEVLVGYVGRLAQDTQLDLLAGLDSRPGMRLVLVGDGPDHSRLERLLPNARFLGSRSGSRLSAAYASLDVFVHPGEDQVSGRTVQQALASGVPVVGPAAGGMRDLVTPGRTGYLFDPGSATSLQSRVATLVRNTDLRLQMAVAARETIAARTSETLGDELLEHYRAVRAGVLVA